MVKQIKKILTVAAASVILLSLAETGMALSPKGTAPSPSNQQSGDLTEKIRHSLVVLPFYGVFDDLEFNVDGDVVTLTGEVRTATLKSDAEWAVSKIGGVNKIVNRIEILPLSKMDDSIRERTYRMLFAQEGFQKYGMRAQKPIRIIVKYGNVTLVGSVASEFDRIVAGAAAKTVPFVFSVTNNLMVD
jgi:hyperosmotically inducible protein